MSFYHKANLENTLDKGLVRLGRRRLYWQIAMLVALFSLLVLPLFWAVPQFHWQTPWNNGQLFSEWLLWAVWYPGTLLSVLLVGRLWCGILCPLGAMSEWFSRIGMRMALPRFIKHPMTTALSFIWVTIWAQTLDVRDDLHAALLLFSILFLFAIVCGGVFGSTHPQGRRVWCRHLCPIGSILGVFSRLGVVNLIGKTRRLIPIMSVDEGYRDHGLCPTSIDLATKQTARHCIKCARCVNPDSKGGLKVEVRSLGKEIRDIQHHAPCFSELWFIWLAPGLAVAGFVWSSTPLYVAFRQALGHFAMSQHWYGWLQAGPAWLMNENAALHQHYLWLDFLSISGFMLGAALLLALPLVCCAWLASYLFRTDGSTDDKANSTRRLRMAMFGYQFAPMAMLCILLGLGSTLFASLKLVLGNSVITLELGLLAIALVFNGLNAWRWTMSQNVGRSRRILLNGLLLTGCGLLGVATVWSIFPTLLFR